MQISSTLKTGAAIAILVSILPLSLRAETMTLSILIQLDTAAGDGTIVERVRSISLTNCLVANAVSLSSDQIVAVIQCDDGIKNAGSTALERIGQLQNVKQATTFSVSKP